MHFGQRDLRSCPLLHDLRYKKHTTPINSHHITISKLPPLDMEYIKKKITEDDLQNMISKDPKAEPNIS